MPLAPGSILHNRYRIEGTLGKGGMGAVYLAYDQTLEIRVAVKENLNVNPESERQFFREATLLAGLRHPNLPRVTDHFVLEGRQYLVMDYIAGVDIHTRVHQQPPSVDEVLRWADALCDALQYLHTHQPPVIHRDIKPANIKLQPDGTIVLVDFGLAKVYEHGAAATSTGARGLTPGYSPPEQYGGARTDARSDQYALAATIYALLTGRPPADSIERMLDKVALVSACSLNPSVPAHVDTALSRALALERADRFPDTRSFQQALRGQLAAPTVRAAEAAIPRRRFPWLALAAVGGLAVIVSGGGAALLLGGAALGLGRQPTATATQPAIVLVPTSTPSPTPLPPAPAATSTPEPSPSPAPSPTASTTFVGGGRRIAFVSDRGEGKVLQIWTMSPDGTDPLQLTYGPGDKAQPRWSPDGLRLAFVAPGGTDIYGNSLGLDIWAINADGTGVTNMTKSVGDDTEPAWSPDGARLAFTSTRSNNLRQVFVSNVTCNPPPGVCSADKPRNFSFSPDFNAVEYSPAWSPDGLRLSVSASINEAAGRIYFHAGTLPAEGPAPTPVVFDRSDKIRGAAGLRWSPDGQYIAFTWVQSGSNEIYIVPANNPGQWERLTNSLGNKDPAFSPDGRYIVFTSTRDQNPEIYLMTITGANEENLTRSPTSRDLQPDWQSLPPSP
jgi:serine/threonine protein kinase